ncbi:MAG: hypothetical protein V4671_28215 [Armatimonadota bacterium]
MSAAKTHGTTDEANSHEPLSNQLAREVAAHLGRPDREVAMQTVIAGLLDVLANKHCHIYFSVPVCTRCGEAVTAEALASIARLNGPLTEQAAEMIAESKRQRQPFIKSLEDRGMKA